jgi:hypothetical protein
MLQNASDVGRLRALGRASVPGRAFGIGFGLTSSALDLEDSPLTESGMGAARQGKSWGEDGRLRRMLLGSEA